MSLTNGDDIIDSRDVIARIEELEEEIASERELLADHPEEPNTAARQFRVDAIAELTEELAPLKSLADEGENCSDWAHGETLIRNSYFQTYAEELAEDIGAIDANATWPNNCIDWERAARDLRMDYTSLDFDGVTYWVRS